VKVICSTTEPVQIWRATLVLEESKEKPYLQCVVLIVSNDAGCNTIATIELVFWLWLFDFWVGWLFGCFAFSVCVVRFAFCVVLQGRLT